MDWPGENLKTKSNKFGSRRPPRVAVLHHNGSDLEDDDDLRRGNHCRSWRRRDAWCATLADMPLIKRTTPQCYAQLLLTPIATLHDEAALIF